MEEKNISIDREDIFEKEDISCGEEITKPFSPNDIKLTTPPMNMGDIIDMIQYNYIEFDTDYQRSQNLWTDVQQSRLIESVLLGLRLPAFYFEAVSKKHWRIIDGLQRCCAIRNFCVDETLALTGMEFLTQFNHEGQNKFSDFTFELKRDIRMLPVTVNVLEKGTPEEVKYILFKRLNTGGIALSPQEIRNAVFSGTAINIVKKMAADSSFLQATMHAIPSLRKQDQDFVSRFVAFYLCSYQNYQPDLENFINGIMKDINSGAFDAQLESMQENFSKAMGLAWKVFGNDAFRKREKPHAPRKPLNKALFEVVSVEFARLTDEERRQILLYKDVLKDNLMRKMSQDKAFNMSFSGGTAKKASVDKRFSGFHEILQNSLQGLKMPDHDNKA